MIDRISAWMAAGLKFAGKGLLRNWQHRLRVLFILIILAQFAVWFDAYWLDATTWLVMATLFITFAVECFPRAPRLLRHALALVLIVCAHLYRLEIRFVFELEELAGMARLAAAAAAVGDGFARTSPFIWFALGAWVIATLTIAWLVERIRIIALVVLSVIVFALVDSYSLHVFWDQVALIVFSGLGLIILDHLDRFRRNHPESWSYLSEYPLTLAGSAVIIVALVMTAGVLAPNAPPVLTDPYTAYMNAKGKAVVTGGKGFASDSVSPTLLNASSGYGRDDSSLGGGFDYDYSEVMRVETPQRTYYRGETKSFYTGSGWEAAEADSRVEAYPVMLQEPLPAYDWNTTGEVPAAQLRQTFYMSGDRSYPVLFGAYPMAALLSFEAEAEADGALAGLAWVPQQGELRWDEDRPYPAVYTVLSEVPVFDETVFAPDASYDFSDERWAPYLQLPDSLPERVRALAREIAAEGATPYEKVKLIEQYLQTSFEYNNRPDLSAGRSPDFVDRFLFEIQNGYCDYFSTAMAVMVRSIGLPARWVKGYASGSLDIEDLAGLPYEIIERLEAGTYIVRNADAHSWVEVYFPETGWVPFEPTAGFVLPAVMLDEQEQAAAASLGDALESARESGEEADALLPAGWILTAVLAALALSAVAAAVLLVFKLRRRGVMPRFRSRRRSMNANQRALAEVNRILRMFRRKGYRRHDYETAREAFARWAEENRMLKPELDEVLDVLEKARYSSRPVSADDVERLVRSKQRMKQAL